MCADQRRILIVDDNEGGRYVHKRILNRAGYEVIEAATGSEGIRRAAEDRPDLIILDVRLPDISGLEVCRILKSTPETSAIPVMQISAAAVDDASRIAAFEGGADTYLFLPVTPELLLATVRALLRASAAEQALRKAALEWQATFDAISDGIVLIDESARIRRYNAAFEALAGAQAAGADFDLVIPPRDPEEATVTLLAAKKRTATERLLAERTFRLTIDPALDSSGGVTGGIVIICDVTGQRLMDQRVREAQKLESIGLLAGGIAHDFNNLLTGIMGNAALAVDDVATEAGQAALRDVIRASERAAELTRQLLAYSGRGRFSTGPVELSTLVGELVPLLHALVPANVRLTLHLAQELPTIEGDRAQIGQVVMNIIINAVEAVEGTGSVTVTTSLRSITAGDGREFMSEHPLEGSYVALQVHDTGKGMDEDTQRRIFDPFFSTKFMGRGLGLSAVLGIMRGHKGAIRVISAPKQGTMFEALFPAASVASYAPEKIVELGKSPVTGAVLVVDDEPHVLSMIDRSLSRAGYETMLAENGAEGLSLFARHIDRISLVILDLSMPVISGQEALERLLNMKPETKVLISSGHDAEECRRALNEPRVAGYLQKPYTAETLLVEVERVLRSEGQRQRTLKNSG